MKRDTALTSPDILAVLRELTIIKNGVIEKFWSNQDKSAFLMRIRTKEGRYFVIMEPGVRVNITQVVEEKWVADGFALNIREHIAGQRIVNVYQHKFDRIIVFEIDPNYKLIVELLSRGLLILIRDDRILFANKHVKMRDRRIIPGEIFKFPPNPPEDPRRMTLKGFKERILNEKDVVRGLVKLGLGSKYAEEICFRCNIDKNKPTSELSDEDIERLYNMIREILDTLEKGTISPRIYYDSEGSFIVSPIELKSLKLPYREFPTFSDAIDVFFSEMRKRKILKELQREFERRKKELLKKIEKQEQFLEEYQKKVEKYRKMGMMIFENLEILEKILDAIKRARKRNMSWEEIMKKIEEAKKKGHKIANIIKKVNKNGKIHIVLDDLTIILDIRRNITELANEYFEKAKKFKKKIERIKEEVIKSRRELDALEKELQEMIKKQMTLIKYTIRRARKKWYESFHWFISSDGFLVVAGKDAQTNEVLVKRYMHKDDIFVHVDIPGGAVVIIKNPEGKEIPRRTILEASKFAAIYSRAWKEELPSVEVFWTTPDCVSKSPPPGHYLPVGSFIIEKKKEILTIDKLELAIGIQITYKNSIVEYRLIMGPPEVIKKQTHLYVIIKPGNLERSSIAKLILKELEKKCRNDVEKQVVKTIKPEHILEHIPRGNSEILK